jgi:hypothetical protein
MNAVNADYQAFLAERAIVERDADKRREMSRLLSSHPYVQAVEKQLAHFLGNVAIEDRPPSTYVRLCDPIPRPVDPYGCENPVSGDEE